VAIESTVETSHKKATLSLKPQLPGVLTVAALVAVTLYSALAISRLVTASAPPTLQFALGTAYRDVPYCDGQILDLYVPSQGTRPLPLAIFVHGQGFTAGDKGYLNPVFLDALASAGYAVASLDYRLAAAPLSLPLRPANQFPVQIEDVKCGIRFLRSHAGNYGIDPARFVAFGTSYGGTLVTLAALTGGHSSFDTGPYASTSSAISAAVDFFGPADFSTFISPDNWRFPVVFGGDPERLVLASPVHYVTPSAPPILIVQGTADASVPDAQSVELYQRLTAVGDQTQLILVQHMEHMFAQAGPQPITPSLPQIATDTVSWFERFGTGP
jgi:acetyl esterase/lipase